MLSTNIPTNPKSIRVLSKLFTLTEERTTNLKGKAYQMNNILASKEYKIPYFASDKKGKYKTKQPLSENQIIKAATAILKSRVAQKGYTMSSSEDTRQLMMTHLANCMITQWTSFL